MHISARTPMHTPVHTPSHTPTHILPPLKVNSHMQNFQHINLVPVRWVNGKPLHWIYTFIIYCQADCMSRALYAVQISKRICVQFCGTSRLTVDPKQYHLLLYIIILIKVILRTGSKESEKRELKKKPLNLDYDFNGRTDIHRWFFFPMRAD